MWLFIIRIFIYIFYDNSANKGEYTKISQIIVNHTIANLILYFYVAYRTFPGGKSSGRNGVELQLLHLNNPFRLIGIEPEFLRFDQPKIISERSHRVLQNISEVPAFSNQPWLRTSIQTGQFLCYLNAFPRQKEQKVWPHVRVTGLWRLPCIFTLSCYKQAFSPVLSPRHHVPMYFSK